MTNIVRTTLGFVEYKEVGQGLPIFFLHGGHSNCRADLFQKGFDTTNFRLITPSRPGYGNTPLSVFKTPDEAAKLMASLLSYLKIEQVVVVGISAGGLTAIALASMLQQQNVKLVLISAVTKRWLFHTDKNFKISQVIFNPYLEWLTWAFIRFQVHVFPRTTARIFHKAFSNLSNQTITNNEVWQLKRLLLKQRSKRGFLNDIHQNLNESTISAIKCPTLILHSVNDASVNSEMAIYANRKINHSQLELFSNKWGHLIWIGNDALPAFKVLHKFLKAENLNGRANKNSKAIVQAFPSHEGKD